MDVVSPDPNLAEHIVGRVIDAVRRRRMAVTATYRLQLHRDFNFRDAAAIVPYLRDLGISHIYCAPYFRAQTGSRHGYDICDHTQFNPELGGVEGFQEFTAALERAGLGHILDIVPNHMAASLENPWWFDVLENGPASQYSRYFDIDWAPVKQELADKILLPVLGRHFGEELEDGRFQLIYREGSFFVEYGARAFPLGPKTTIPLLSQRLAELRTTLGEADADVTELESIITALDHLPPQSAREPAAVRERHREKSVIKRRLNELTSRRTAIRDHIQRNLAEYGGEPGKPESWDRLDQLLDQQPYRLSHWRAAADEINYRRFFDVNELAAICMEQPEVFHAAHVLLRPYLADGTIHGLRVDHADGLYDPEQYLWRLQWAYLADLSQRIFYNDEAASNVDWSDIAVSVLEAVSSQLGMKRPSPDDLRAVLGPGREWEATAAAAEVNATAHRRSAAVPLYVLVEKILNPDEPLPENWPVAGTSGYDFLNVLGGLFLAPQGYIEIQKQYARWLNDDLDLGEVEHAAKLLILRIAMSSELQMLAHRLNRVSEQHRRSRDYTLNNLRVAIREVLASFPVYRVYPGREGISERDRRFVNLAVVRARRRNPASDPAVFEFLRSVLLLAHPAGLNPEQIAEREVFTGKFQQVTSPVMAKGVEDTAFYLHLPLLSVNEVGNDPKRAATSVTEFHEANVSRGRQWRRAMLTTSTHDTKRSEDVRARLHVLSEVPRVWRTALARFARTNKQLIRQIDGEAAPSRNDEYLFYQSLIGIWPLTPPDANERKSLIERLTGYMEKATREAKQRTSWNNPNEEYDAAVREFVAQSLRDSPRNRFLKHVAELLASIVPAGHYNSLSQVALKLLSPGAPDLYQGQELWDFSLVDPDNRRAVDYELRRRLIAELRSWDELPQDYRRAKVVGLARAWSDPRLKLLVTTRLLELRRRFAEIFSDGEYVPLEVIGPQAEHLVAFGWRATAESPLAIIAVIPRQVTALISSGNADSLWIESAWRDTTVALPANSVGDYRCVFTEQMINPISDGWTAANLLAGFPLAVLARA